MSIFENIVVTDIDKPFYVFSEKGRVFHMENRPCFGLSFCCGGRITYSQNGLSHVSLPGTAVLLPQNSSYSLYGDETGIFPVIDFECEGLDLDTIQVFPLQEPEAYLSRVKTISNLFLFKENKAKIYSLFYDLLDRIQAEQTLSKNPLHPIMDFLEQHISDGDLTISLLADKLGISQVYFRKLFALHYGMPPKQYILDIRIKKAQQLLAADSRSVTQIAEACGFASVYHFCRIFKQKTGMTPSEYAKKHRVYHI